VSYSVLNFRAEKGRAGFLIWRYLLRRDDPSPAPWEEGAPKYQCIVPDLCKDESTDAENPTKKIKLEMYTLDEEMKKLADADEVIFFNSCFTLIILCPYLFLLKVRYSKFNFPESKFQSKTNQMNGIIKW
jgi:hypothetical protein